MVMQFEAAAFASELHLGGFQFLFELCRCFAIFLPQICYKLANSKILQKSFALLRQNGNSKIGTVIQAQFNFNRTSGFEVYSTVLSFKAKLFE